MKSIGDILKTILPGRDFSSSQDFIEDGLIDSFDLMRLITSLEEIYGIEIDVAQINEDNFKNIQTMELLIEQVIKHESI